MEMERIHIYIDKEGTVSEKIGNYGFYWFYWNTDP